MKLSRIALGVLPALMLFAGSAATWADDKAIETKFTRYVDSDDDDVGAKLEVAFATYTSKTSDVKIILYGAVHIADKAYYKKVNDDLASYDCVLFEGVSA